MSKYTHTPGPWTIVCTSKRDFGTITHVGPEDHPSGICEVYGSTDDEPKANIALIAASPDLLEAVEKYLDAMERYGHPDKTGRLMRAAVRKARGV